jgi:hypothetical protein
MDAMSITNIDKWKIGSNYRPTGCKDYLQDFYKLFKRIYILTKCG